MCKFCDSNKEKDILSYNNHDSMNVYYGQYQGVSIYADLSMKGNMLILNASGSYRSRSDCYYEDEGIDCDGEHSNDSQGKYVKIKFCPFCGKKLDSTEFEKKDTEDTIKSLEKKLKKAQTQLEQLGLHVAFTLITKEEEAYKKAYEMIWESKLNLTLETMKNLGEVKVSLEFGNNEPRFYEYPPFDAKVGASFSQSSYDSGKGKFYGIYYCITEKQYDMLVNMGFISKNNKKLKEMKEKQANLQEDIKNMENKLEKLKNKLKKL